MKRISLEQIFDLPYPSILSYLKGRGWDRVQGYKTYIITSIIYYTNDYLLREKDRQIVKNPDFISVSQLSDDKLIERLQEDQDTSIFSSKAEILRKLLESITFSGRLMTFGANHIDV